MQALQAKAFPASIDGIRVHLAPVVVAAAALHVRLLCATIADGDNAHRLFANGGSAPFVDRATPRRKNALDEPLILAVMKLFGEQAAVYGVTRMHLAMITTKEHVACTAPIPRFTKAHAAPLASPRPSKKGPFSGENTCVHLPVKVAQERVAIPAEKQCI